MAKKCIVKSVVIVVLEKKSLHCHSGHSILLNSIKI